MPLPLGRRRRRPAGGSPASPAALALVASGVRVTRRDAADSLRRLAQPWQQRSFAYYDLLGEIKYAAQFYARGLSPLRLYPGFVGDDGDVVETDEPLAVATLARVQDPGGGRRTLLASYGRLMFLVGESLLLASRDADTGAEQWEMLSRDELRVDEGGVYQRYRAPSLAVETYRESAAGDEWAPIADEGAVVYRLWRRHPRYSDVPDATMQGVLDLAEELVLLTQAVRARARSRLAGMGILFLSDELSPPPLEPGLDEDPEMDPTLRDLIETMTTAIVDEGSAAAVAPIVVRGPTEAIEKGVRHLKLVDPTELYPETGLREECIRRIALGLDMPAEVLTGLASANHWTGWLIQEEVWRGHLQPVADQLVADLTAAYYRPTLRAAGLRDWQRYRVAYDASAVIMHPDRAKDAKDAYDRRAIGKAALRRETAFHDDDAPTDVELAEMIGVEVGDPLLATSGVVSLATGRRIVGEPGTVEPGTSPAEARRGPPEAAARIAGAADLAVLRAREAAGNRIRSLAKRDPEAARELDGTPPSLVAAALGRERTLALGAPGERELVAGARGIVEDALRAYGVDDGVAGLIADAVEQHAARTLYDERPAPLPPTFARYLEGLGAG